jgi:hypothetical protein
MLKFAGPPRFALPPTEQATDELDTLPFRFHKCGKPCDG